MIMRFPERRGKCTRQSSGERDQLKSRKHVPSTLYLSSSDEENRLYPFTYLHEKAES